MEYGEAARARAEFREISDSLSEEMRATRQLELDETEMKLKRRMLGNIRFIGELCKKGMLKVNIMHNCMWLLLSETDEVTGKKKCWKPMKDEQEVEMLCKLLTTVGATLDADKSKNQHLQMDEYFDRMQELSQDKSLNSRLRFGIQEVIELRRNDWQARREQEGPATIEQIHRKAAEEEQLKRQNSLSQPGGYPGGKRGGNVQQGGRSHQDNRQGQGQGQSIHAGRGQLGRNPGQQHGRDGQGYSPGQGSSGYKANQHGSPAKVSILQPGTMLSPSTPGSVGSGASAPSPSTPADSQSRSFSSSSVSAASASASACLDLSDDQVASRVQSIIDEFIAHQSVKDVRECLLELPPGPATSFLVAKVVQKFFGSSKPTVHDALIALLDSVGPFLASYSDKAKDGLNSLEEIHMLCDTITDCKLAPEYLGRVVGTLIRTGACGRGDIDTFFNSIKAENLADEFGPGPEVTENTFSRLFATIDKYQINE